MVFPFQESIHTEKGEKAYNQVFGLILLPIFESRLPVFGREGPLIHSQTQIFLWPVSEALDLH